MSDHELRPDGPAVVALGGGHGLSVVLQAAREYAGTITGDKDDVDRITNHVLGDACTPGNAKECTFETVRPVIDHSMNGDLDDLLG